MDLVRISENVASRVSMFEPTLILKKNSPDSDFKRALSLVKSAHKKGYANYPSFERMLRDFRLGNTEFDVIKLDDEGYFYTDGHLVLDPGNVESMWSKKKRFHPPRLSSCLENHVVAAQFIDPKVSLQPDNLLNDRELSRMLRQGLAAEHEAVHLYEWIADATDDELVSDVLQDIANEERVHAGEFQRLLTYLLPEDEQNLLDEGEGEVEDVIDELGAASVGREASPDADPLQRVVFRVLEKDFKKMRGSEQIDEIDKAMKIVSALESGRSSPFTGASSRIVSELRSRYGNELSMIRSVLERCRKSVAHRQKDVMDELFADARDIIDRLTDIGRDGHQIKKILELAQKIA